MSRLSGEFEKQRAMVILFPSRTDVWRGECRPIREIMVELANIVAEFQEVIIGVLPELRETLETEYVLDDRVKVVEMQYNDCWARDTVSSVVTGEKPYIAAFRFNAYGAGLYKPWDDDDELDYVFAKEFGYDVKDSPITLEGGNICSDGNGTLFAVREAIVNDNRNPGMSLEEIEEGLKDILCLEQIVWIERGLLADETGGHIDNIMAFADKTTIVLSWTDDVNNPQYELVREIEAKIKSCSNVDGEKYNIVHLPVPNLYRRTKEDSDSIVTTEDSFPREEGDYVLETYVNFALANGVVVVPQFGNDLDAEAVRILKEVFSDRKVIPLRGREASLGGGGFHCLTKHIN
ncbi:MAG: agmatine deiminase family protein [Lachnospiraceae bacterium]|nr:agmatine deiminase family protein [Lachnospiraceae bacterium]